MCFTKGTLQQQVQCCKHVAAHALQLIYAIRGSMVVSSQISMQRSHGRAPCAENPTAVMSNQEWPEQLHRIAMHGCHIRSPCPATPINASRPESVLCVLHVAAARGATRQPAMEPTTPGGCQHPTASGQCSEWQCHLSINHGCNVTYAAT